MQGTDPRTLQQLADEGNTEAQVELGKLKLSQEKYDDAASLFKRAADQGHADAMCLYASLLSEGLGVDQDLEAAAYWLRQAAEHGHSRAQLLLAQLFESGQGVPTNHQIAAQWYLRAAEQDDHCAQWRYGQLLRSGQGVEKNLEEAVQWLRKAAEAGQVDAMLELAETLRDLPNFDADEFRKWVNKAADQGSVHAVYLQGWLAEITGSINQIADAVAIYRKAAEAGSTDAQMRLGKLYAEGKIVAADPKEAERWLSMVVEPGKAVAAAASAAPAIPTDMLAAISTYATINEYPPGTIIENKYFIMSVLGKGGMCMVYKAKHLLMNKMVALKMLLPEIAQDAVHVERFRREAQAASSLDHPNIITIYDMSMSPDGKPFMIMDFLDGISLEQRLESGKLKVVNFLSIFLQVTAGLEAAHQAGIVHRDIKPSNIMLVQQQGQSELVKIVDFGLAKSQEGDEQLKLTKSGEVHGTLMYMSPEQCLGHPLDGRSDIYAVGCTMYEALDGKPVFGGKTPFEVMNKHINVAPEPFMKHLEVPAQLEAIILKALAKDRENRQQSMAQLQAELTEAMASLI